MSEEIDLFEQFGPFGKDLENASLDYVAKLPPKQQQNYYMRVVETQKMVDAQRKAGERPRPSKSLVSIGENPNIHVRGIILDLAAKYADNVQEGRSRECVVFAAIARALLEMGNIEAELVIGRAEYPKKGGKPFAWDHAWLEIGDDIVDGNLDSMQENPMVPRGLTVPPYWGSKSELKDRMLKPRRRLLVARERVEISEHFPDLRLLAQQEAMRLIEDHQR